MPNEGLEKEIGQALRDLEKCDKNVFFETLFSSIAQFSTHINNKAQGDSAIVVDDYEIKAFLKFLNKVSSKDNFHEAMKFVSEIEIKEHVFGSLLPEYFEEFTDKILSQANTKKVNIKTTPTSQKYLMAVLKNDWAQDFVSRNEVTLENPLTHSVSQIKAKPLANKEERSCTIS